MFHSCRSTLHSHRSSSPGRGTSLTSGRDCWSCLDTESELCSPHAACIESGHVSRHFGSSHLKFDSRIRTAVNCLSSMALVLADDGEYQMSHVEEAEEVFKGTREGGDPALAASKKCQLCEYTSANMSHYCYLRSSHSLANLIKWEFAQLSD